MRDLEQSRVGTSRFKAWADRQQTASPEGRARLMTRIYNELCLFGRPDIPPRLSIIGTWWSDTDILNGIEVNSSIELFLAVQNRGQVTRYIMNCVYLAIPPRLSIIGTFVRQGHAR